MESGIPTVLNKLLIILEMIKFEHSIFALPFAYMGALLAAYGFPTLWQMFWITVAMVGARSLAMCLNRLIDKEIDARNPRTASRALPKRLLSEKEVIFFNFVSLFFFLLAVYNLAPLCRWLWPLFVLPFVIYPYTKRFTWACHFVLGFCLGLAPVGAWIAITNGATFVPFVLGLAVCFWVAGFDIIYACQDIEVDKKEGLYSIPVNFGVAAALRITSVLHVLSVLFLFGLGAMLKLGSLYFVGVAVAGALLFYENRLVSPHDLSKIDAAFFTMNGIISTVVFLFTLFNFLV